MRRLIALALIVPLIGAAVALVPQASACASLRCSVAHCDVDIKPPNPRQLDPGSAHADCDLPLPP